MNEFDWQAGIDLFLEDSSYDWRYGEDDFPIRLCYEKLGHENLRKLGALSLNFLNTLVSVECVWPLSKSMRTALSACLEDSATYCNKEAKSRFRLSTGVQTDFAENRLIMVDIVLNTTLVQKMIEIANYPHDFYFLFSDDKESDYAALFENMSDRGVKIHVCCPSARWLPYFERAIPCLHEDQAFMLWKSICQSG